ncbi:MAG: NAD(P)H-hydrate dehydratase [Alphaproteobacteria bacterium]
MRHISPAGSRRAALLTTEQMAEADRLTIAAGAASLALMEQAGRALARHAMEGRPPGSLLVLAGPGNNGGDGFVAARYAQDAGWRVRVGFVGETSQLRGDAAQMAAQWHGTRRRADPDLLDGSSLVIDAIFGAGLSRPIDGAAAALIETVNRSGIPVVSADIPSGVDGNTGAVRGVAVQAERTVTFFRSKPGHWLLPGRRLCGAVHVADIGIPDPVLERIGPRTFLNGPGFWTDIFPRPGVATHKNERGHVMVVSGGPLNTGAARLAAMGALRAGAGLVTVLSPPEAAVVNATHLTAIMVSAFSDAANLRRLAEEKAQALVIGPAAGVSEETRRHVLDLLALGRPIVLDADALTVFADRPDALFQALHGAVVLTPHLGEFRRLFPDLAARLSGVGTDPDRLLLAREAARRCGATVLLKGPDTIVAGGSEPMAASGGAASVPAAINTNAPPDLATAGSGDVLAGLIAGLMAQGLSAFAAAGAGAWLHGEVGRRAGRGLIAEDLPGCLPAVLTDLDRSSPHGSEANGM